MRNKTEKIDKDKESEMKNKTEEIDNDKESEVKQNITASYTYI